VQQKRTYGERHETVQACEEVQQRGRRRCDRRLGRADRRRRRPRRGGSGRGEEGHGLAHHEDQLLPLEPVDQLDLLIRLKTRTTAEPRPPFGARYSFSRPQTIVSSRRPPRREKGLRPPKSCHLERL